jgi:hypothetical protein
MGRVDNRIEAPSHIHFDNVTPSTVSSDKFSHSLGTQMNRYKIWQTDGAAKYFLKG